MTYKQLDLFATDDEEEKIKKEVEGINLSPLFERLAKSQFRSSFYLNAKDKAYIQDKGWEKIEQGTRETIARRLAPAFIANDGKQTPMRHGIFPPFIAQHATGCCCRGCLEKWHGIPRGRALTLREQIYLTRIVMEWLRQHDV
ncbi:DUF4186 domain-containing protein [Hallella mizrahii]|uniref:DUF4186 domain-containing protein n=1 Tax=Hallella mizrahii TaxID=2606637 RepID=A0A7K0KCU7_9BACT|nr:DUF4186 domain-containing protein [Hallella mizrahii]MST83757.1 DUF4186 domain-containing protein [Hallella mizrahii]